MGTTLTREYWQGVTTSGELDLQLVDPQARRRASEQVERIRLYSGEGSIIPVVDFAKGLARFVSGTQREALIRSAYKKKDDEPLKFTLLEVWALLLWWFDVDADERVPRRQGAHIQVTDERYRLLMQSITKVSHGRDGVPYHWIQSYLHPLASRFSTTGTLTAPQLLACDLLKPAKGEQHEFSSSTFLLPLLDYRKKVMIKRQPLTIKRTSELKGDVAPGTTLAHPLIGFTYDVLYGRLLRELTTRWPRVVTIHYATCIDAFVGTDIRVMASEKIEFVPYTDLFLYQVTEHAESQLSTAIANAVKEMKEANVASADIDARLAHRLSAWVWQLFFSLAAAAELLLVNHGDPHTGNIMVSPTKERPYHNRTLAYRRRLARTLSDLVYLTPEDHGNVMVEIIDFGLSEPRATAEQRDAAVTLGTETGRELAASRFIDDMIYFFTYRGYLTATLARAFDGETNTIAMQLAERSLAWLYAQKQASPASRIFYTWPTMPMFEHLMARDPLTMAAPTFEGDRPVLKPMLVGYMPDDEEMRETVETRPPHSLSCVVCNTPATMASFAGFHAKVAFHCDNAVCAAIAGGKMDAVKPRII